MDLCAPEYLYRVGNYGPANSLLLTDVLTRIEIWKKKNCCASKCSKTWIIFLHFKL